MRANNGSRILKLFLQMVIFKTVFSLLIMQAYAVPVGPTITVYSNTTKAIANGTNVNSTVNEQSPGGYIFTIKIDSRQQNSRWKAYVGNATGTFALDDSDDNTIFEWSLVSIAGEVYATRSSNINWSGINCTWIADGKRNSNEGYESSNRTPEHNENKFFSHTNSDDNITATFAKTNHSSVTVGTVVIGKDECFTLQTWKMDSQQVFADSDDAKFTELLLYDGSYNKTNGDIIYATQIEQDETGYRADSTYDFQMIVPENSITGFSSSTAYYFYIELS
jgi:hypothetical protein